MSAPMARWPEAPDDARSLTEPDAHLIASIEATIAAAVLDFGKTLGRTDGTRSAQVVRWRQEFATVAGGGDRG